MRVKIGSEVVEVKMEDVVVDREGVNLRGDDVSIDLSADEMAGIIGRVFSGDGSMVPIFKVRLVKR